VKKDVAQKLVTGSIHEALAEHQLDRWRLLGLKTARWKRVSRSSNTATVEVGPRVEPKDTRPERHPDRRHGH